MAFGACEIHCPQILLSLRKKGNEGVWTPYLRGPAAILFISRDICSDSIAKLFRARFNGVSRNYRAIRSKMGYRTDVPVKN